MTNTTTDEATDTKGEYRELRPDEIGDAIRMFREFRGWKQINLAQEAHVDERTIQRIEQGTRVSAHTLERIAVALGLERGAFVGPRFVLTKEEAFKQTKQWIEEFDAKYVLVDVTPLDSERCFDRILHTSVLQFDDQYLGEEAAEAFASFKELLTDWNDLYREIPATDQLDACRSLLKELRVLEAHGYTTRFGTYNATLGPQRFELDMTVIVFFKTSDTDRCALPRVAATRHFKRW